MKIYVSGMFFYNHIRRKMCIRHKSTIHRWNVFSFNPTQIHKFWVPNTQIGRRSTELHHHSNRHKWFQSHKINYVYNLHSSQWIRPVNSFWWQPAFLYKKTILRFITGFWKFKWWFFSQISYRLLTWEHLFLPIRPKLNPDVKMMFV